jgi:N-carbamoyl-L-amino-acid hydrolase
MVPDGGNYDGTLGSLSALEVIEILNENQYITAHPLEVIILLMKRVAPSQHGYGRKSYRRRSTTKSQIGLTQAEGIKYSNPDAIAGSMRKKEI